jgi:lactoylglutathione lyase
VIEGVNQVILEVEDQDRALRFWTEAIGFEVVQDAPYGEGGRWLEVRTRDKAVTLVLSLRRGERQTAPEGTYEELRSRGVAFPQPPVQQSWGWWSMFQDQEGNRFALHPREANESGTDRTAAIRS